MSIQPFEPADLILRGPTQVAASIPYLLGFQPSESLVVVFATSHGRHILTARVDVPRSVSDIATLVDSVALMCWRAHENDAAFVSFIFYLSEPEGEECLVPAVQAVQGAVEQSGLRLDSISSVRHGIWRDELDDDVPAVLLEEVGLDAAAQWVAHGVTYEQSREALAARVCGSDTELARHVRELVASRGDSWKSQLVKTQAARRLVEDQIFDYLMTDMAQASPDRGRVSQELPKADDLATWAVALADNRVREPVLWRLAAGFGTSDTSAAHIHKEALPRLCALVRNVPNELVAPIASCAAAFAWQLGDGAMASIAADHGLSANPRNVLCGLVMSAVVGGVHPRVWIEMLGSMTLKQLRSGPCRNKPHNSSGRC